MALFALKWKNKFYWSLYDKIRPSSETKSHCPACSLIIWYHLLRIFFVLHFWPRWEWHFGSPAHLSESARKQMCHRALGTRWALQHICTGAGFAVQLSMQGFPFVIFAHMRKISCMCTDVPEGSAWTKSRAEFLGKSVHVSEWWVQRGWGGATKKGTKGSSLTPKSSIALSLLHI